MKSLQAAAAEILAKIQAPPRTPPYIPRTQLHAGAAAASGTGHVTSPSPVELGATNTDTVIITGICISDHDRGR
jgi:hypothetical protein